MNANYRNNIRFFQGLANQGRPDLAAQNAATDGRWRLAVHYAKVGGLPSKDAWRLVWRWYRQGRRA